MAISETKLRTMKDWAEAILNVTPNSITAKQLLIAIAEIGRLREELYKEKTKRTCWDDPD